jgi:hypothetical protein
VWDRNQQQQGAPGLGLSTRALLFAWLLVVGFVWGIGLWCSGREVVIEMGVGSRAK